MLLRLWEEGNHGRSHHPGVERRYLRVVKSQGIGRFVQFQPGELNEEEVFIEMVICAVEGCGREKFARVWCSKHYQRWYHNGNPERPYGTHKSRACKAGECREKPYSKSATYCPTHSPVVQADELLTYSGAHQRVATKRGKASAHICAHCNAPAQEWAYDHADPDEKQSDRGSYSLDENHYISLCVSCHTKMDRKRILVSR